MPKKNLLKIFPSVLVQYEGFETAISIEWYQQNKDSVQFIAYVLLLYYDDGEKKELLFNDFDAMITAAKELYTSLKK